MRSFVVTDLSHVGEVRREAICLAKNSAFNELGIGKVALIATELATNLVKHATSGQLLMRMLECEGGMSLEFLSLDRGPGIANVAKCMEDGHSTGGSLGTGLGAIVRTSDEFDIYSQADKGTVAVARIASRHTSSSIGVIHQAKQGEPICGDAWLVQEWDGRSLCVVADGLGHGPIAAKAAIAIVESMPQTISTATTLSLIEMAHQAAKPTCGASLGVAIVDHNSHEVRFAGVGNISAVVLDGNRSKHLVSYDGVIGDQYRKVREDIHPWSRGSVLVMHSDGLGTRWDLKQYPGLLTKDPSLIAGVLYRDFARTYDDTTVVVKRWMH